MCEPVTMAAVSAGMTAIGTGVSVAGSTARADKIREVSGQNADAALGRSADAVARGLLPESRARWRGGQMMGAQRAQFGAQGGLISGSAMDVLNETTILSTQDAEVIANNAARDAAAERAAATNSRMAGAYGAAEENNRATMSVLSGAGKLIGIAGSSWQDFPPSGAGKPGFSAAEAGTAYDDGSWAKYFWKG